MSMRTFAIGDIHGNLKALKGVLGLAQFDPQTDMLIGLGDYVDGQPDSYGVIEYLMSLPHFKGVIGNHDVWFRNWLNSKNKITSLDYNWYRQGGKETLKSYTQAVGGTKLLDPISGSYVGLDVEEELQRIELNWKQFDSHKAFLNGLPHYMEIEHEGLKYLIVHGGFNLKTKSIDKVSEDEATWSRDLWDSMKSYPNNEAKLLRAYPILSNYGKVIIGHTAQGDDKQIDTSKRVINLDLNSGYGGYLALMELGNFNLFKYK